MITEPYNPLADDTSVQARAGLAAYRATGCPVSEIAPGLLLVTTHEATRQALLDHASLSNAGNFILHTGSEVVPALITQSDPPEHTFLRGVLRPAFQRKAMVNALPWIGELVDTLIDRLPPGGPADIVTDLAMPLTSSVIGRLVGIPEADWSYVADLCLDMAAHAPGDFFAVPSWIELEEYLTRLAIARRTEPDKADDILSRLVMAEHNGRRLTDREVAFHTFQVFVAGLESTAHTIGWTVYQLLAQRTRWEELVADRSLIASARDEGLRHCTAIRWVMRKAIADTAIDGVTVPAGSRVVISLESANLDEAAFGPDAADFDVHRAKSVKQFAFGHGIHLCLGSELSQLEITSVLERLLDRMPGLRLADGFTPQDVGGALFRGLRHLHVVW